MSERQTISGYALKPVEVQTRPTLPTIDNNQLASLWNEWPTIEESFGTALQPQRAGLQSSPWPHQLFTPQPTQPLSGLQIQAQPEIFPTSSGGPTCGQWTTSFWNNINQLSEMRAKQSKDINNNAMDRKYSNESVVTSNDFKLNNDSNGRTYRRKQSPIGTPIDKRQYNCIIGPPTDLWPIDSTDREEYLEWSQLENLWYIQPKIRRRQSSLMECVFCKNNNERPEFYRSHILKDPESNIQCPVLRAYDCPICHNGGGSKAHTIRYCPLNKAGLQSRLERMIKTQTEECLPNDFNDHKKRQKYQKKNNY